MTRTGVLQSEPLRPIPLSSVESELECTSRIYFDNETLTLHNYEAGIKETMPAR